MKVPRTCIGLTPEGCWSLAGRTCLYSRQGTVETKGPGTSSGTGHWVLLGEKASVGGLTYCTEITENAPKPLPKLNVPWPFQILSQHFHSDSHTQTHSAFPPLCCHSVEALTRSEADTWQQSPPCLPLTALTMRSSKATAAEGEWTPPPTQALLRDYFHVVLHSWTFNSSLIWALPQLLTRRANLLSQPQRLHCAPCLAALALTMQSN